ASARPPHPPTPIPLPLLFLSVIICAVAFLPRQVFRWYRHPFSKKLDGADHVGPEAWGQWAVWGLGGASRLPWGGTVRFWGGNDNELDAVNLIATVVLMILALGRLGSGVMGVRALKRTRSIGSVRGLQHFIYLGWGG